MTPAAGGARGATPFTGIRKPQDMSITLSRAALAAAALSLSIAAAAPGIGGARAHGGATGIVHERMEAMKAVAAAMKAVGPMIQGATRWDPEAAQAAAASIAAHGGAALTAQFPEGSGGGVSEASPRIWEDPARFAAMAEELKSAAEALEKAAAGGAPPKAEFGRLARSCKSCHEAYRVKR